MAESVGFVEHMEHAAHGGHADQNDTHGHAMPEAKTGEHAKSGEQAKTGEHVVHEKHHGKNSKLGKHVGVSMACLGVLLALCSALVGGQRSDLIYTMLEQTNTAMKFQTISTKYRVLVAQLTQLDALTPDNNLFNKWEAEIKSLDNGKNPEGINKVMRVIRLENAKNLNAEIPTHADMVEFADNIKVLGQEREAAEAWTESYKPAIKLHEKAAEQYEWAQLSCEVGIVVASIALLFLSRAVWIGAMGFGLTALLIVSTTYMQVGGMLLTAHQKIEHASKHFESFNSEKNESQADAELLKSVESENQPVIDPTR